jgi:hypothetical protein
MRVSENIPGMRVSENIPGMIIEKTTQGMIMEKVTQGMILDDDFDSRWTNHNQNNAFYFTDKKDEITQCSREDWERDWLRWHQKVNKPIKEIS